ncbi:MAG TPA: CHY zinc finger protein [Rhizomicrobium sp.]|jgi:uncharacterized CHY-type Zn-finger protein|nr:CHY zinc finger protein [Rhizomicrobium sp.]
MAHARAAGGTARVAAARGGILRPRIHGVQTDSETRCVHYRTPLDVIAIRMKCCGVYYACKDCHDALAGHAIQLWSASERDEIAVLCGVCGTEMTIRQYLECAGVCPACAAPLNPGCRHHHHFYFEVAPSECKDGPISCTGI